MIQSIITTKAKPLHQKAQKINKIDAEIVKIAQDMLQTKKAHFGIGLAANQIGLLKRIIAVGGDNLPEMILVNPEIIFQSKETNLLEESCLSVPGIGAEVQRAKEIKIKTQKITFFKNKPVIKKTIISAKNILSRVIQHEIDHLDGKLFTERVKDIKTFKKIPERYKVVFFGTPEFSVPVLQALVKNNWAVSLVVTEPDKPFGRKKILTPPPIKKTAEKYNLLVYQPKKIINLKSSFINLKPDLIILTAYGKIIPKEILEIPVYGALCLHPSLLPKYRGPSPIQTTILNGDKTTGVTLFKMDEKIDHGPILAEQELKILNPKLEIRNKFQIINSQITTEVLSQILSKVSAEVLLKTLPNYLESKIKPKKQNEKKASYTKLIKKEDGHVDKSEIRNPKSEKELKEIERKIRAFYPWPKVWTIVNNKRVIIHKAHLENFKLSLDIVQPEGKKPMKYEDYLKGNPKIA